MRPKYHFIFGIIFVTIFYFLFPQFSFSDLTIIFISSFLIDADHIFYSFIKNRNINPIKSYKEHSAELKNFLHFPRQKRKKIYLGFYIFHGIEWLIILFLLGFYIDYFFFLIFIGFSFHLLLDFIYERYLGCSFDKSSLIYNYYRFKKINS